MWIKTPQVVLVSKGERHFQRQWGVPDNQGWNVNLWEFPGPWFHWKDATLLDPYDEDYEEKLKARLDMSDWRVYGLSEEVVDCFISSIQARFMLN